MRTPLIKWSLPCIAVLVFGNVGQVKAGTFSYSTWNLVSFNNFENGINADGSSFDFDPGVGVAIKPTLTVGDRYRGVLLADTVDPNGPLGPFTPPSPEVTGIFDLKAMHILPVVAVKDFFEVYNILFGPSGTLDGLVGYSPPSSDAGVMMAFYEDSKTKFSVSESGSLAASEGSATDGTLLAAFGMTASGTAVGDLGEWGAAGNGYFYATVFTPDVGGDGLFDYKIPLVPLTSGTVNFFYGLEALGGLGYFLEQGPMTKLYNKDAPTTPKGLDGTLIPDNFTATANPLTGGTTAFDLVGAGTNAPNGFTDSDGLYTIYSHDPAYVHPNPEPATMVLMGIGGLLLGGRQMWRRRKTVVA